MKRTLQSRQQKTLPENRSKRGGTIGCTKVRDAIFTYRQNHHANLVIRNVQSKRAFIRPWCVLTSKSPQFSIRFLLGMTMLLAIPLAGFTCVAKQRNAWREKLAQLAKQDVETLKQIVDDVEAIREKLGRAPESQAELESILGRSLPKVHDGGYPTFVNYRRTSEDSYTLQYELWATDDWIFDSTNPDAGWVQHFY